MTNSKAVGQALKSARINAGFPTIAAGARYLRSKGIEVSDSNLGNTEYGRHISGEAYLTNILRGYGLDRSDIDKVLAIAGYVDLTPMMPVTAQIAEPTYQQRPTRVATPVDAVSGLSDAEFESIADATLRVLSRNIATLEAQLATTTDLDARADLTVRIGNLKTARERRYFKVAA